MIRFKWSEAPSRTDDFAHPPRKSPERFPTRADRHELESIAAERQELALYLWSEAVHRQAAGKNRIAVILLGAALLLASLLLFAGIQPALSAFSHEGAAWLLLVFATAAALIFTGSIILSVFAILFLNARRNNGSPLQESLFFNPFSGSALYTDSREFKKSFQGASRELLVSAVLEELFWLSDRERRMQNLARWASILFLIGLIPYLLTIIALAARIL